MTLPEAIPLSFDFNEIILHILCTSPAKGTVKWIMMKVTGCETNKGPPYDTDGYDNNSQKDSNEHSSNHPFSFSREGWAHSCSRQQNTH